MRALINISGPLCEIDPERDHNRYEDKGERVVDPAHGRRLFFGGRFENAARFHPGQIDLLVYGLEG